MKKTLCFYFQIHQPVRLRRYRFFDIGKRHDYFDEYVNRSTIRAGSRKMLFADESFDYGLDQAVWDEF